MSEVEGNWRGDEFWRAERPQDVVDGPPDYRDQLREVLDSGILTHVEPTLDDARRLQLAAAIRAAVFEMHGRVRASKRADRYAWFVLGVFSVGALAAQLLLLAHWHLHALAFVLSVTAELAVFGLVFRLGWGSRARRGSPGGWSYGAVVNARLTLWSALGVVSALTVLATSRPDTAVAVAIAAPLLGLPAAFAVVLLGGYQLADEAVTIPGDPYAFVLLGMLAALATLNRAGSLYLVYDSGGMLPYAQRRALARWLEHIAIRMERDRRLCAPAVPDIGPEVVVALANAGAGVCAWLRALEVRILSPDPAAAAEVQDRLARGLLNACAGDWGALQAPVSAQTRADWLGRVLPRVLTAAALLAGAWLIPVAFGHALNDPSATALRVTLIITALTALLAPARALSDAGSIVTTLGAGRRPPEV